ncbi:DUF3102 domain-containing protein, partial [Bacillus thuringiensis]
MNEVITLSTDINVITAEIKSYQQIAGQSIFEIGKRLKHVKENDLAHGDFGNWLIDMDLDDSTARKFMRAYTQFEKRGTFPDLPSSKIFQIIALPSEIDRQQFIEEPHTIPSTGEEKTVDEMTVRELREVKKSLKEKDKLLQQAQKEATQARKSEQLTRKQLEELEQQAPTIVEKEVVKEVEIVPDNLLNEIDKLKDEASFYKQKADALSRDVDDIQLEESSMNYIANKNVHNLIAYMDDFLKDVVVSSLMRGSIATASDTTKELLDSRIEAFQEFLNDLK